MSHRRQAAQSWPAGQPLRGGLRAHSLKPALDAALARPKASVSVRLVAQGTADRPRVVLLWTMQCPRPGASGPEIRDAGPPRAGQQQVRPVIRGDLLADVGALLSDTGDLLGRLGSEASTALPSGDGEGASHPSHASSLTKEPI